jgi:glycosyltransferase 2 family protein
MSNHSQRPLDDTSLPNELDSKVQPPKPSRRWVTLALQMGVTLAVIGGVGRRVWMEKEALKAYDLRLSPSWLLVSGVCYLAGLWTAAVFWRLAMRDRGEQPGWTRTFFAYYAGHLGKYVPGKGLVVVIRARMIRGPHVTAAGAAMACVHETILTMATGAFVSLIVLLAIPIPRRDFWLAVSGVLTAGLAVLACPPVVSRLGKVALRPFSSASIGEGHASRWGSVGSGSALITMGWLMLGLSLLAVLAAMQQLNGVLANLGLLRIFALSTALVALAFVGGFVTLTPAGLGTREWILVSTLGPLIGTTHSMIAAVLLRIVWVVSEVVATGIFWMVDKVSTSKRTRAS